MAVKGKPLRQELVRIGDPDDWLGKVEDALASAGFTKIRADRDACVCSGNFHKGTVWGELEVELDDASPGQTRLSLIATAAKDNIWTVLNGADHRPLRALPAACRVRSVSVGVVCRGRA